MKSPYGDQFIIYLRGEDAFHKSQTCPAGPRPNHSFWQSNKHFPRVSFRWKAITFLHAVKDLTKVAG